MFIVFAALAEWTLDGRNGDPGQGAPASGRVHKRDESEEQECPQTHLCVRVKVATHAAASVLTAGAASSDKEYKNVASSL